MIEKADQISLDCWLYFTSTPLYGNQAH